MAVITTSALALLHRVKGDNEMVFVLTEDSLGCGFEGRILKIDGDTFDVEATDGDVVYNVPVRRIMHVDVRPLKHYSGYGVTDFVRDVTNAPGWNR